MLGLFLENSLSLTYPGVKPVDNESTLDPFRTRVSHGNPSKEHTLKGSIFLLGFLSSDISDEFKRVIEALHPHDDKIRIVLNKADMVDGQQLMRVYGALMWSLGKILATPEVARVYAGMKVVC